MLAVTLRTSAVSCPYVCCTLHARNAWNTPNSDCPEASAGTWLKDVYEVCSSELNVAIVP